MSRVLVLAVVCLLAGCGYWPSPRPAPSPLPPNVDSLQALTLCESWPPGGGYHVDAAYDSDAATVRAWVTILQSDPAWVALPNDAYVAACYLHGAFAVPMLTGSPVPDEAVAVVAQAGPKNVGPVGFHGRMKLVRPHP